MHTKNALTLLISFSLGANAGPSYEEIIVSAQKRSEQLLDTPMSIAVLGQQQIIDHGLHRLSDLSGPIVNFQVSLPNGPVLPIFTIRGVSMVDYSVNQSSPVGVYVDEIALTTNYTQGLSLFDLERVEVLRGPQGTLYGKNTTGGAINIISKTPDFIPDGYITLTAGNYDRRAVTAAAETPLIDNRLAIRLAYTQDRADGYADNHFPGGKDLSSTDHWAGRMTLFYANDDYFDATLKLSRARAAPEAAAIIPQATDPGGLDRLSSTLALFGQPYYKRPDNYDRFDTNSNRIDQTETTVDGASLRLNWLLAEHTLTSITGYVEGDYDHGADADGTPQSVLETSYVTQSRQWSQEFRLVSPAEQRFRYTIGIFYAEEDHNVSNQLELFHGLEPVLPGFSSNTGFTVGQTYQQEHHSRALYGQIDYALTPRIELTTGLRYSKDKNRQFNVQTWQGDYDNTPLIGLIPFTVPYDSTAYYPAREISDEELSGTLKLAYRWREDHRVYASYSHGYRSSAFNGAAVFDAAELEPVEPETVDTLEFGAKGVLAKSRLSYQSAVFFSRYHNQQFLRIQGVQQLLDSADRAEITGWELEFNAAITDRWTVDAGLALLDGEYTKGPVLVAQGQEVDLTGNRITAAPNRQATLSTHYRHSFAAGEITSLLAVNYTGHRYFSAFNDDYGYAGIEQPGYSIINARMDYQPNGRAWSLALWGNNLGNKEYKTFALNLSETFGYHYTVSGPPRTWGVDVKYTF